MNTHLYCIGFEDSYDDSILRELKTTNTDSAENSEPNAAENLNDDHSEENTSSEIEFKTTNKKTCPKMDVEIIDDSDLDEKVNEIGRKFATEVLPRVHTMANGMKLLGVEDTDPFAKQGDVYKLRIARPDMPIGYSEVWEDRTTIRLNSFSKLVSEETMVTNFRVELATLIPGIQDADVVGLKATRGLFEMTDTSMLTLKPFIQRKTSELAMLAAEIVVMKKVKQTEVSDIQMKCTAWFGDACKNNDGLTCALCNIRDDVNDLRRLFEKRFVLKMERNYFSKLEDRLIKLLRKLANVRWLILTQEGIEQIIMIVGLELLRKGVDIHMRGLGWGACGRLEHLINVCRAALCNEQGEGEGLTVLGDHRITVWNDEDDSKPKYLRSHMVHAGFDFICGYGLNLGNKKSWNGFNLAGLRRNDRETKRRLRVINIKEKKSTDFQPPVFDADKGTFNFKNIKWEFLEDTNKPLIPAKTVKKTFMF